LARNTLRDGVLEELPNDPKAETFQRELEAVFQKSG
jgi:hypothetical protein